MVLKIGTGSIDLTQLMYSIFNSEIPDAIKKDSHEQIIKYISEIGSIQTGRSARLRDQAPYLLLLHKFRTCAKPSLDEMQERMGSSYNDPTQRLNELMRLHPVFKDSEHDLIERDCNILLDFQYCINKEDEFIQKSQNFLNTQVEFCRAQSLLYNKLLESNLPIRFTADGIPEGGCGDDLDCMDQNEKFAFSIIFGRTVESVVNEGELRIKDFQKLVQMLSSSSLPSFKHAGEILKLDRSAREVRRRYNVAAGDIAKETFSSIRDMTGLIVSKAKRSDRSIPPYGSFSLATPRMAILLLEYAEYLYEYYSKEIEIYRGTQHILIGEKIITKIRNLNERISALTPSTLDFRAKFITHYRTQVIKFQRKIMNVAFRNSLSSFLDELKINKQDTDKTSTLSSSSSSSTKLTPTPNLATAPEKQVKKKKKPKPLSSSPAKKSSDTSPSKTDKSDDSKEPVKVTPPSSPTAVPAFPPGDSKESVDYTPPSKSSSSSTSPTLSTAPSSTSSISSSTLEDGDWELVRNFTDHPRVSRWNYDFEKEGRRVPFSEYAGSRQDPFKVYTRHHLTPAINELIYNPSFHLQESFKTSSDGRERFHLYARINYPDGDSEIGTITHTFIKEKGKKIRLHRYFSLQPQGELIDPTKRALLFARIVDPIEEDLSVGSAEEASEFDKAGTKSHYLIGTTRCEPHPTLGYITYKLANGVSITVFKHTL